MSILFQSFKTPVKVSYKYREHKTLHYRVTFELPYRYNHDEATVLSLLSGYPEWAELEAWLNENIGKGNWHTSFVGHPPRRSFFFRTESQAFHFKMVWG